MAKKNAKQVRNRLEIDFVANQGSQRICIQSALSIPDKAKEEQETRSLLQADDSFQKVVIVKDNIKPWSNDDGVLFISLYDFLLNDTQR